MKDATHIWIKLVPRASLDDHDKFAEILKENVLFQSLLELLLQLLKWQKIL